MGRRKRLGARRGGRRERFDARRGEESQGERYKLTQKLVSIGDDYYVENEAGERVFEVDGKALRVRDTLKMNDLVMGDEYKLQEKMVRVRDTMAIQKNGQHAATVKKAVVSPIRDRFIITVPGSQRINVKGNVLDYEYQMTRDGELLAEVSKQWFRARDSYSVEVMPGMDAGLVIACTVVLDMMTNPTR